MPWLLGSQIDIGPNPGRCRQADQRGATPDAAPKVTISIRRSAAMSPQSGGEAVDQSWSGEGLGQEANGPGVQRFGTDALIGKGRDEDERHKVALAVYHRHKLRAAHNRHLHICNHTRRVVQLIRLQELIGRRERTDRVPIRPQEIRRRGTDRCIIINDGYRRRRQKGAFKSEYGELVGLCLSNRKMGRKSSDKIILWFVNVRDEFRNHNFLEVRDDLVGLAPPAIRFDRHHRVVEHVLIARRRAASSQGW
jgi:hypothetical protein